MTASTTTPAAGVPVRLSRRKVRLLGVIGAVGAALTLWAATELFFMDVLAPGFGGQHTQDVGAANVIFSAGLASLAAWALLALLERFTRGARMIWTTSAVAVFLFSLGGPMSGDALTAANRSVLILLHVAVAAVLIPVMYRTAAGRGDLAPS